MENDVSPLAAFPNEHPTPPPSNSRPFYKSKTLLLSTLTILVLCVGVGGYMMLGKNQKTPQIKTSTPVVTKPTSVAKIADPNSYTNTKYSYVIEHVSAVPTKESDTSQYSYTEFLNGCFKVYVVPKGTEKTLREEQNGIPWKQLDDLKSLPIGEKRNCSILSFTFGPDGKAIVDKNYYKKLPMKTISGISWYTFEVENNIDPQAIHNVYFTENTSSTYVIETLSGGSCPEKKSSEMLSHFLLMK